MKSSAGHILYVEDDQDTRELVTYVLAQSHYKVTLAVNAEDYGYLFLNIQLPPAASLERTDQVSRKIEAILKQTEGVQFVTSINGFSLLNRVSASYNGFCFISLQPWSERKQTAAEILKTVNGRLAGEVPEAMAFAFSPPAIPGLGNSGGFSFWLQDRSGGSVELLDQNLQKFLAAARQRPELAGVGSQFSASSTDPPLR